jgi:hypothetical protein
MFSKNKGNVMKKSYSLLMASTVLLISCAKEKKFEEIYKDSQEVFTKSALSTDLKDPYIYVPSTGEIPMTIDSSRPFTMGDARLVTFRITKDKLRVMEVPSDKRFQLERNLLPVMEFDIEHKDYRCAKDQFNECSNKEEEIDDIAWEQKRFIKADFSKLSTLENNTLPEQLDNLFDKCAEEEGTRVKKVEITKEAVNLVLEKTYKRSLKCRDIRTWDDILNNNSYSIDYKFSFVKASTLATKNYQPFVYDPSDINTFGFFTTYLKKLGADNAMTISSDKYFLNRWNPNRGEITYYLNDEFYGEGMERVKDATIEAVNSVNASLKKAQAGISIKLADGRNVDEGDIRNSFIVMVKDPVAAGLLGYGPSVANPMTGEIVKANTMMYYGTTVQTIQRTYEEMVREAKEKAEQAAQAEQAPAVSVTSEGKINLPIAQELKDKNLASQKLSQFILGDLKSELSSTSGRFSPHVNRTTGLNAGINHIPKMSTLIAEAKRSIFDAKRVYHPSLQFKKMKPIEELTEKELEKEREMAFNPRFDHEIDTLSRKCYYHESYIDWDKAFTESGVSLNITADSKPWEDLTEEEKQKIIDAVLPKVWVPTLIHELGHNLGLRHNFSGSEDKDNYYTSQERSAMGINREVTYSSIMDYSYSELNILPVMGKYDIAALRFGYRGEVLTAKGETVSIGSKSLEKVTTEHKAKIKPIVDQAKKEALAQATQAGASAEEAEVLAEKAGEEKEKELGIVEYMFCTDEHAEVNPGCNRFDEGAGLANIARHYVKAYKLDYERRYTRKNRLTFSGSNDDNAYMRSMQTFRGLRLFFEVYDRINGMYPGLPDSTWESIEFLKDIKEAAGIALDFYVEVLTTPDVHCLAVSNKTGQLAGMAPLKDILNPGGRALSCFDSSEINSGILAQFTLVGETGLHVNHVKGKNLRADISADPSELSVRGIWMDKTLALRFLTQREFGISTFDDYRSNFLDYPAFREKALKAVMAFVNDESTQEREFKLIDGSTAKLEQTFSMISSHKITESFNETINMFLGLRSTSTDFRSLLIPRVRRMLRNNDDPSLNMGLSRSLKAEILHPATPIDRSAYAEIADLLVNDASVRLAAMPENTIAKNLLKVRTARIALTKLQETIPEQEMIKIYTQRREGKVPTEIPENLKPVYEFDIDLLFAFLTDSMPSDNQIFETFSYLQ